VGLVSAWGVEDLTTAGTSTSDIAVAPRNTATYNTDIVTFSDYASGHDRDFPRRK